VSRYYFEDGPYPLGMRMELMRARYRIKITTAAPHSQTYEGTLFTYCPILHIVAIDTRSASDQTISATVPQPGDYRMFPEKQIQSFQLLSRAKGGDAGHGTLATAQPAIRRVDIKRLELRAKVKIDRLKEEERDNGKGVSKEAQAIFDSLKRMYVLSMRKSTKVNMLTNTQQRAYPLAQSGDDRT